MFASSQLTRDWRRLQPVSNLHQPVISQCPHRHPHPCAPQRTLSPRRDLSAPAVCATYRQTRRERHMAHARRVITQCYTTPLTTYIDTAAGRPSSKLCLPVSLSPSLSVLTGAWARAGSRRYGRICHRGDSPACV